MLIRFAIQSTAIVDRPDLADQQVDCPDVLYPALPTLADVETKQIRSCTLAGDSSELLRSNDQADSTALQTKGLESLHIEQRQDLCAVWLQVVLRNMLSIRLARQESL